MISLDTIARVRERTDIIAVVRESVPSLKRRGRAWVGVCPFHKEKTPSFHVNPDRGFFHCFGCKESGTAIDFVMRQEGASFPEAVRSLAERAGIPLEEEREGRAVVDRQRKQRDDLYAANQIAATFFEAQLREHPEAPFAWSELERRGLRPTWALTDAAEPAETETISPIDDALQAFRIGYAPPGWDGLANYLRDQGISPIAAEAVGLLVPRSSGKGHYDRFRHRLMFAVLDVQGRVVAFSGRALPEIAPEAQGDPPPKYINSPESPVYTKGQALFGLYQARHAIRRDEQAIVVEGNFDVVSLHARGLQTVVAPLGTAFTGEQANLLRRFSPNATLLFDADAAGRKAIRAAREACREAGLATRVALLPDGQDPDEFVRTRGIEALSALLAQSRGLLEFLIDTALDVSFTAADAHERAARVEQVARLLAEEDDPLVRSMAKSYADHLAGRLDLQRSPDSFRVLEQSVRKALAHAPPRPVVAASRNQGPPSADGTPSSTPAKYSRPPANPSASHASTAPPNRARVRTRLPGSSERGAIVAALIEFPELLDDAATEPTLLLLDGDAARTVAALAGARNVSENGEKNLDTAVFLAQIPPAIQAFASERLAAPRHATLDDARADLLQNGAKLQGVLLSLETDRIARQQYEVAGDWQTETELAKEAQDRARQRHGVKG